MLAYRLVNEGCYVRKAIFGMIGSLYPLENCTMIVNDRQTKTWKTSKLLGLNKKED